MEEKEHQIAEHKDKKGLADSLLGKFASRKLIVWATATYALFSQVLESSDWVAISLVYIGSQALVDLAATWKRA